MDVALSLPDVISALLGANLVGIYAYEGPAPAEPTTTALLVVTVRDLLRDAKYGLINTLLRHSGETAPLELLVVRQADLAAAPALPVQLHYTEAERPQFADQVGSIAWLHWPDGSTGAADRAGLIARLQHTGRTLVGRPLPELLGEPTAPPPVPDPSAPARQLSLE